MTRVVLGLLLATSAQGPAAAESAAAESAADDLAPAFLPPFRDGAMGGSPFSSPDAQGFATGLYLQPNQSDQGTPGQQLSTLLACSDWVRYTLAGNMREYSMQVGAGCSGGLRGGWAWQHARSWPNSQMRGSSA